jgi:hypothetical protein
MQQLTNVTLNTQIQEQQDMITCKVRTIPEHLIMCIPDWITNYQPVDDVDARLFNYFRQLYQEVNGSKKQQRVISQIYNILVTQKLINETASYKKMRSLMRTLPKYVDFKFDQYNYTEAVSKGYIWLSKLIKNDILEAPRICFFDLPKSQAKSLTQGLKTWIINYIAWRLLEIHIDDLEIPDSLDIPQFNDDFAGNETKLDHIPDGFQDVYKAPTLDGLLNGDLINQIFTKSQQRLLTNIEKYLQTDPFDLLKSRYIGKYPELNYHVLAQRLIVQQPPDKIRDIYRDFNIPKEREQGIYADIDRNFYPTIASISIELGDYPVGFLDAILNDIDERLKKCNKIIKGEVVYNAQILAQKLLPLFNKPDFIFTTIVNYLNNKGHELKITTLYLDDETSFAIYSEITSELKKQGLEKINAFKVLTYWETAIIDTFVTELQTQGYKKITYEEIKTFWDEKCRIRLGKLAISLNKEE